MTTHRDCRDYAMNTYRDCRDSVMTTYKDYKDYAMMTYRDSRDLLVTVKVKEYAGGSKLLECHTGLGMVVEKHNSYATVCAISY